MLFSLWFSVVTEVLFGLKGWYSKGEIFITYAITVVKWTFFLPIMSYVDTRRCIKYHLTQLHYFRHEEVDKLIDSCKCIQLVMRIYENCANRF